MIQGRSNLYLAFILAMFAATCAGLLFVVAQSFSPPSNPRYTSSGTESCLACHFSEKIQAVQTGPHGNVTDAAAPEGNLTCESCHGPGSFHVSRAHGGQGIPALVSFAANPDSIQLKVQVSACQRCHAFDDGIHPLVRGREVDMNMQSCGECHEIHSTDELEESWDF